MLRQKLQELEAKVKADTHIFEKDREHVLGAIEQAHHDLKAADRILERIIDHITAEGLEERDIKKSNDPEVVYEVICNIKEEIVKDVYDLYEDLSHKGDKGYKPHFAKEK